MSLFKMSKISAMFNVILNSIQSKTLDITFIYSQMYRLILFTSLVTDRIINSLIVIEGI